VFFERTATVEKFCWVLLFQLSLPREDDNDETTDFAQQCHLSELNSNYIILL